MKKTLIALAIAGMGALPLAANAAAMAAVTVTDVVTGIENQAAPVGLVAAAVLGLHVVVKAYKWIRRALS